MKSKHPNRTAQGKLALLGVGGGGCALVSQLAKPPADTRVLLLDSDNDSLCRNDGYDTLLMGSDITRGLGCGSDSSLGEDCVRAGINELNERLDGATAVVIVAPMGGGFGTGAAIAIAKQFEGVRPVFVLGLLPLAFEGTQRAHEAAMATASLRRHCAAIALVENSHCSWFDVNATAREVFHAANEKLAGELRLVCRYWLGTDAANLTKEELLGAFSSPGILHEVFIRAQCELSAAESAVGLDSKAKTVVKSTQQNLPFKSISRGRFESSPPSIHNGTDLDVPTFWRWNVVLDG